MSTAPLAETDQLTGVWQIDPAHSEVSFTVRHLMARVRGSFASFGGTISVGDDPARSSVRADIDTTSVDTRNAERDKHLRSADYFDTDTHPTAHFASATVRDQEDGRHSVEGFMTVKGETRPVTLNLVFLGIAEDRGVAHEPDSGRPPGSAAPTSASRAMCPSRRARADRGQRRHRTRDRGGQAAVVPHPAGRGADEEVSAP
ncbi:YceI family protein [Streptomyces sp. NPDC052727]|uniref:YceI family protein n=1 Tax=Streptomyces sp. NPDC052727 TaxID=3154854 RepID=UPI003431B7F7